MIFNIYAMCMRDLIFQFINIAAIISY